MRGGVREVWRQFPPPVGAEEVCLMRAIGGGLAIPRGIDLRRDMRSIPLGGRTRHAMELWNGWCSQKISMKSFVKK